MNRRKPKVYLFKSWTPLKQNGFRSKRVKLVSSSVLRMTIVTQEVVGYSPMWDTELSFTGTHMPSFHKLDKTVTVSHFKALQYPLENQNALPWKITVRVSHQHNKEYSVEILYHHPDFDGGIARTLQQNIKLSEDLEVVAGPNGEMRVAPDHYFFFKRFVSGLSEAKRTTVFELIDRSAGKQGDNWKQTVSSQEPNSVFSRLEFYRDSVRVPL